MDRFLDDFGQTHYEDLALIRYHTWWPVNNNPLYLEDSTSVHIRVGYYPVDDVPNSYVDGQFAGNSIELFPVMYEDRMNTPSPFVIDVQAEVIDDSVDLQIDVFAELEPEVGELRLMIAVCESYVFYPGLHGYNVWKETMRMMIPDANGYVLEISQGDTVHFHEGFKIKSHWDRFGLSTVVCVQSDETQEILQGARWHYPDGELTGTVEDENGFPVENAYVVLPGTYRSDSTDAQGQFSFRYVGGSYEIVTTATALFPDTTAIEIVDDSTTTVQITLNELPTGVLAGTVSDSVTAAGLNSKLVLLMNSTPWDSTFTNPETGFFFFQELPISFEDNIEYDGLEIFPSIPYSIRRMEQIITITEEDTVTIFPVSNPGDVLLVDDDEGLDYEIYIIPAIEYSGRTFVHLDANSSEIPASAALQLFPLSTSVVWFTGDADSSTLSQTDQDSLTSFLERGGKLFLTGQNIAEELTSLESSFLTDYLHTQWVDNFIYEIVIVFGDSTDPLGRELDLMYTHTNYGAQNQTSRDILEELPGANEAAYYVSLDKDNQDQEIAAIWTEGPVPGSRVVFFGFGLEAASPEDNRDTNMRVVLDWLDGLTAIVESDGSGASGMPRDFSLDQNFPNPFNPITTITFEIPGVEKIQTELSIFDIRGRLVRVLIDEVLPVGRYRVTWDGRNGIGNIASSGIYFYRIKTDSFSSTRKMTLIK